MWKSLILLICLSGYCCAGPVANYQRKNMPIVAREDNAPASSAELEEAMMPEAAAEESAPEVTGLMGTLTLPSNATSIRAEITDNFSCENRAYGYYADVENDCQIFHVCLPVTYADGKENTFRWSFICPEETIFSQESFTCMRSEDMTIGCEESAKYYALNANFGNIEEDSDKHTNDMAATEEAAMQSVQQEAGVESESAAATAAVQPVVQKPKPAKVKKPIRRKPAVTYTMPKKENAAATLPLRKLPQSVPTMAAEETIVEEPAVAATQAVVSEVEAKPTPQRYNKRPAVVSTNIKEKIQSTKTAAPVSVAEEPAEEPVVIAMPAADVEAKPASPQRFNKRPATATSNNKENVQSVKSDAAPTRTELFNQKRKRPSYFNKKDAATTVRTVEADEQPEVDIATAAQAELSEPEPTLKLESMFSAPQEVANVESNQKPAEEPIVPDVVAEASEPIAAVAQPEEAQPALAAESAAAENANKVKLVAESETPIAAAAEQNETPEMAAAQTPIEAFEEIPAVIVEAEEQRPQAAKIEPAAVQSVATNLQEANENIPKDAVPSDVEHIPNTVKAAEPAIFEPSNSDEALPQIEDLETARPADAPESMVATPEMEQHSPMVEQMLGNDASQQQSLGGFKPVDPEMAAEAEQLITDFLNTLRARDPMMPEDQPANIVPHAEVIAPAEEEQVPKIEEPSQEDTEQTEAQKIEIAAPQADEQVAEVVAESEPVAVTIEEAKMPAEIQSAQSEDKNMSVEEQKTETNSNADADDVNEPQYLKNAAPISNVLMLNNLPADMYQIPVKVIETPLEEVSAPVETIAHEAHSAGAEENMPAAAEQAPVMPPFAASLSIDDIVELVKERLDQTPKGEQPMPMELVLTNDNEKPVVLNVESMPVNEEPAAIKEESAPVNEEAAPVNEEPEAVHLKSTPISEESAPVKDESVTVDAESAPVEQEPAAVHLKSAPAQAESAPVKEESIEQPAPVQEESMMAEEQPAIAAEVAAPANAQEMQIPSSDEEASAALKINAETETPKNEQTDAVVVPIYQRVVEAEPSMLNAQAMLPADADAAAAAAVNTNEPVETVVEAVQTVPAAAEPQAKASRAYRSRSVGQSKMDARKRRFLFRADAS